MWRNKQCAFGNDRAWLSVCTPNSLIRFGLAVHTLRYIYIEPGQHVPGRLIRPRPLSGFDQKPAGKQFRFGARNGVGALPTEWPQIFHARRQLPVVVVVVLPGNVDQKRSPHMPEAAISDTIDHFVR